MMKPPRAPEDPRFTPIMLRKELLGVGWKDKAIADAVKDGSFHKVRYGAYVDGPAWRGLDPSGQHELMTRAVLKQARTDLVVSHVSALPIHDVPIWDLPLDVVHGTRPDRKAGRVSAGVVQHCGELRPQDVCERHGLLVTSATRAALEITTIADVEHSLCVVNHLLHEKLTTQKLLAEGAEFMREWPDSLHTDLVLRLADPRIESIGETRSFFMMFRHSVPPPVPQYELLDRGRVVARLDFAWPELGVWLEFDGRIKYLELLREGETPTDAVLREKAREAMICRLTGWRCIRITWADLMHPERTVARIMAELTGQRVAS